MSTAFDSSNNKMLYFLEILMAVENTVVGTVSGTSISFGSLDVFTIC